MATVNYIVEPDDRVLVTGARGFIGKHVVDSLLGLGFRRVTGLTRALPAPGSSSWSESRVDWVAGNLLSNADCARICREAKVVFHLAAGRGEKSYADAFLNSVVTTRNLLEACRQQGGVRRFVNISSFAVYTNCDKPNGRVLDESAPVEAQPARRNNPYCFAKVKQEQIVSEYGRDAGISVVTLRPGVVYGPGNEQIHGRVGIASFGIFLHLGGSNQVPLTYVDNCAHAIVLAGLVPGVDGEVFNVVDDDLPNSGGFLRRYKREVKSFRSLYVPKPLSYLACWAWERYCARSHDQLPPAFSRAHWHANWKPTCYRNDKLKQRLGWAQPVTTEEGLRRHFASCRGKRTDA